MVKRSRFTVRVVKNISCFNSCFPLISYIEIAFDEQIIRQCIHCQKLIFQDDSGLYSHLWFLVCLLYLTGRKGMFYSFLCCRVLTTMEKLGKKHSGDFYLSCFYFIEFIPYIFLCCLFRWNLMTYLDLRSLNLVPASSPCIAYPIRICRLLKFPKEIQRV